MIDDDYDEDSLEAEADTLGGELITVVDPDTGAVLGMTTRRGVAWGFAQRDRDPGDAEHDGEPD